MQPYIRASIGIYANDENLTEEDFDILDEYFESSRFSEGYSHRHRVFEIVNVYEPFDERNDESGGKLINLRELFEQDSVINSSFMMARKTLKANDLERFEDLLDFYAYTIEV